jgi:hypothetical protein
MKPRTCFSCFRPWKESVLVCEQGWERHLFHVFEVLLTLSNCVDFGGSDGGWWMTARDDHKATPEEARPKISTWSLDIKPAVPLIRPLALFRCRPTVAHTGDSTIKLVSR